MSPRAVSFRQATEADLDTIADIHKRAYSASHFTALLPLDVLKAYYGLFLADGAETLLIADERGHVLGFAVYGEHIGERIAAFKRNERWRIARTALRHPLTSLGKASGRVIERLRPTASALPAEFLLLSIAVFKKGDGIGRLLLDEMMRRAAEAGYSRVGLYVNTDNIAAINSYVDAGFRLTSLSRHQYYLERALK